MQRKHKDIRAALTAKGFVERDQGDHIFFVYHRLDGRKSQFRTKLSHDASSADVGAGLLNLMARQVGLTTKQFVALVDCALTRADYDAQLPDL